MLSRMGSVLLAAWISQQETTFMTAAPIGSTGLPEGAAEQVGAVSKGHQQVTAWQVRPRAPPTNSLKSCSGHTTQL